MSWPVLRLATVGLVWAEMLAALRPSHHVLRPEVWAPAAAVWGMSSLFALGIRPRLWGLGTGLSLLAVHGVAPLQLEGWMAALLCLAWSVSPQESGTGWVYRGLATVWGVALGLDGLVAPAQRWSVVAAGRGWALPPSVDLAVKLAVVGLWGALALGAVSGRRGRSLLVAVLVAALVSYPPLYTGCFGIAVATLCLGALMEQWPRESA